MGGIILETEMIVLNQYLYYPTKHRNRYIINNTQLFFVITIQLEGQFISAAREREKKERKRGAGWLPLGGD